MEEVGDSEEEEDEDVGELTELFSPGDVLKGPREGGEQPWLF